MPSRSRGIFSAKSRHQDRKSCRLVEQIWPSLWCLSSFVLFVSWWGPCPDLHLQHCRATPAERQEASCYLDTRTPGAGTPSADDTVPCCPGETVGSPPGSRDSPNWMKCHGWRTTWALLPRSPAQWNSFYNQNQIQLKQKDKCWAGLESLQWAIQIEIRINIISWSQRAGLGWDTETLLLEIEKN